MSLEKTTGRIAEAAGLLFMLLVSSIGLYSAIVDHKIYVIAKMSGYWIDYADQPLIFAVVALAMCALFVTSLYVIIQGVLNILKY